MTYSGYVSPNLQPYVNDQFWQNWFSQPTVGYNQFDTSGKDQSNWWWHTGGARAHNNSPLPVVRPPSSSYDPQVDQNQLYGKPIVISALGLARIGSAPAPVFGPYIDGEFVSFGVSFGYPADPSGTRVIYDIALDDQIAWRNDAGWDGTGAPGGTFLAEPFTFRFYQGRLDQAADPLQAAKFPDHPCALRPQMLVYFEGLPKARFEAIDGKPVPYVACKFGDTTEGADPLDGINIGEAIRRYACSPWVGYTSATFDVSGITDAAGAMLLSDNLTVIDLSQATSRAYRNIRLLQDDKLRLVDRGATVRPDFVFDRDTILAAEKPVEITRTDQSAQKKRLVLTTPDPDQDWMLVPSLAQRPSEPVVVSLAKGTDGFALPFALDAATRQALVTYAQYYEENARKKIRLKVLARGYEIMPGDLFAVLDLATDLDGEVFLCVQTDHGADFTVEIEGEAILRCSVFSGFAPTPVGGFDTIFIGDASDTSSKTDYDFTQDFGNADTARYLIAGFTGYASGASLSAVEIGGVAATFAGRKHGGSVTAEIWFANVPLGTSGTISAHWTGAQSRCSLGLWGVIGAIDVVDAKGGLVGFAVNSGNVSVDADPDGFIVACAQANDVSLVNATARGMTQDDTFGLGASNVKVTYAHVWTPGVTSWDAGFDGGGTTNPNGNSPTLMVAFGPV
jgi:hypothetical protein